MTLDIHNDEQRISFQALWRTILGWIGKKGKCSRQVLRPLRGRMDFGRFAAIFLIYVALWCNLLRNGAFSDSAKTDFVWNSTKSLADSFDQIGKG